MVYGVDTVAGALKRTVPLVDPVNARSVPPDKITSPVPLASRLMLPLAFVELIVLPVTLIFVTSIVGTLKVSVLMS